MQYKGLVTFPSEREFITYPWVYWDNGFTEAEVNQIAAYCAAGELREGKTFTGYREDIRRSKIQFNTWTQENGWIFDKLIEVVQVMNNRWYGFDLNGFDAFQYGEYRAEEGGHFEWHTDMHFGAQNRQVDDYGLQQPRKLSLSMALNEPGVDFEGGDFQLNMGHQDLISVPMPKGRIIVIPSFLLHRVTRVTKGVRKSIVAWVTGPKFV
jgi:PKHD-type hydroxylase